MIKVYSILIYKVKLLGSKKYRTWENSKSTRIHVLHVLHQCMYQPCVPFLPPVSTAIQDPWRVTPKHWTRCSSWILMNEAQSFYPPKSVQSMFCCYWLFLLLLLFLFFGFGPYLMVPKSLYLVLHSRINSWVTWTWADHSQGKQVP